VHAPVPEQPPPDQPAKVDPEAAVAVSVTLVPTLYEAWQVAPQLIPEGLLVTVPVPVPFLGTDRLYQFRNVAVTAWAEVMATVQVAVPAQPPPDQPAKVDPAAGVAVSVTYVPQLYEALHVVPQSIPEGLLVTAPVPFSETDRLYAFRLNVAVTPWAEVIVTVQVPVPEQPPPDQPAKVDPAAGVAVSVTPA
jgi:hypothetical protein